MSDFVEIGVIGRPHGIKGELCVIYYAESPDLLHGSLFLRAGKEQPRAVTVQAVREHRNQLIIRIEGVADRSAAEVLRGQSLLVPVEAMPALDDEVYLYELMGFAIIDDVSGKLLGHLDHVMFHTDPEVWAIVAPDGKEFFLPAVPQFIADIDMQAESIRITPPEGLLDIYGITMQ